MIGNLPQDDVTGQMIIYKGEICSEIITHVVKVALSSNLRKHLSNEVTLRNDEERERAAGMRG